MSWRYIAQRALTGEFLDWDVPMERDDLTWTLSGAGALRGTVTPDVGSLRASDGRLLLEEWGTLLYAEEGGRIRWGGIVVSSAFQGEEWSVEAAGFATYPYGNAFDGDISNVSIDPADAFRAIWANLQAHPDGNLGVVVDPVSTPVRLGRAAYQEDDGNGGFRDVEAEPYTLSWWDTPDAGRELDSLVTGTPFDFVEHHFWDGDEIRHRIEIGYPRLGRRREDLAFIEGDNIADVITVTRDGDDYANEVIGLGAGEGPGALRSTVAVRDGRLRRSAVYTDKTITDESRLSNRVRDEMTRRLQTLDIREVTVRQHPNAVIGSWALGDDILIQADVPWLGEVSLWCRITSWSLVSEDVARLTLARSDAFRYGAA